jgi:hypothetical protein
MKKLFTLLLLLFAAPLWAQTTTPNLGLVKPTPIPGTWAQELNENFDKIDAKFPGGQGGHVLQDEGSDLPVQPKVNFIGSAVSCVNNAGATRIDCTITGGGGGSINFQIDGVALTASDPINIQDTSTIDATNPSAGNLQLAVKPASIADSHMAAGGISTRTKLPSAIAYEDEVNTFTEDQAIGTGKKLTISNFGIHSAASDTDPSCGAGVYWIKVKATGAAWYKCENGVVSTLSGSTTPTWQAVITQGRRVTDANSFANCVFVGGSSTSGFCIYDHATNGPTFVPVCGGVENDCDHIERLATGKYRSIKNAAGVDLFKVTESGGLVTATGLVGGWSIPISRSGGLQDTDDFNAVLRIPYGQTVAQVCARTDTGTSVINLQRDDGSAANILTSNLTAATTEACTTTFVSGENVLSEGHYINFVMVTAAASGTPTKVTVSAKTTRN